MGINIWRYTYLLVIVTLFIATRFGPQLEGVMGFTTSASRSGCRYNAEMTNATCSKGGLTSIPDIPATVLTLDLSFNAIAKIPTRAFSKLPKLQSLYLGYNLIHSIEPFAFDGLQNLTTLDIEGNVNIQTLEDKSFANIPRLNYLKLGLNKLQNIATDAFIGTSSISEINLYGNRFSEVPSIGSQPRLSRLDLSVNYIVNASFPSSYSNNRNNLSVSFLGNEIETLDNFIFSSLAGTPIVHMHLSANNITAVAPGTFDPFTSIESLFIGMNPLSIEALGNIAYICSKKEIAFVDLFGTLQTSELMQTCISAFVGLGIRLGMCATRCDLKSFKRFTTLRLSQDELVRFSELQFTGKNILAIDLAENKISSFPPHLPASLESIDLSGNQIQMITYNEMSYLGNLKLLFLSNNDIDRVFPGVFDGLGNLQVLDLDQNSLSHIYLELFAPLQNLTHLYLRSNRINFIKASILPNPLVSLRILDLSNNGLETVDKPFSVSFPSLQILCLDRNNLGEYFAPSDRDGRLFSGLTELEELYISSNNLQNLPNLTFGDQVSLKLLDISKNLISSWGHDVFKFTKNIEKLDVSFNKISALTDRNLHNLNNLQELNLKGNPFICNCDLLWFREWIDSTSVALPDKESYTCLGPEEWRGKPLLKFTKDKINCTFISVYAIVGSVAVAIFVSVVFGICVYKNRWRIDLRLYLLWKRGRRFLGNYCGSIQQDELGVITENDRGDIYDAYISCSDQDYDWVIRHLLPGIDNGRYEDNNFGGDFKLYFDPRDQEPGTRRVGNIFEHMTKSRKVIIVLSQNYVNDGMNIFELDQATILLYQDQELEDIIVLKVGDVPAGKVPEHLYTQMRTDRFIEWEEGQNTSERFKEKLRDRLQSRMIESTFC